MTFKNERIHISPPKSVWTRMYEEEVNRLKPYLHSYNFHYAHIGSTAIPGVVAKPIIDIMVGSTIQPTPEPIISVFEALGYEFSEVSSQGERFYFIRRELQDFNIQLVRYNSTLWCNNIFFRDYLRANRLHAKEYSILKQKIINCGVTTLVEYSQLKQEFIASILQLKNDQQHSRG